MARRLATPETLVITSESGQLARVRAWLGAGMARRGVDARTQSAIQVAVGELATNSIKHAYGGRAGQPIHISLEATDVRVVVELEDFGTPFDPDRYRHPDLDQANERGVGLYIVRRLTDELDFDVDRERGTRWRIVKYRGRSEPGSS
jgi:serine/threonine-protein kinase RsbW